MDIPKFKVVLIRATDWSYYEGTHLITQDFSPVEEWICGFLIRDEKTEDHVSVALEYITESPIRVTKIVVIPRKVITYFCVLDTACTHVDPDLVAEVADE